MITWISSQNSPFTVPDSFDAPADPTLNLFLSNRWEYDYYRTPRFCPRCKNPALVFPGVYILAPCDHCRLLGPVKSGIGCAEALNKDSSQKVRDTSFRPKFDFFHIVFRIFSTSMQ